MNQGECLKLFISNLNAWFSLKNFFISDKILLTAHESYAQTAKALKWSV